MSRYNDNGCFIDAVYNLCGTFAIIELICLPFVYAYSKGVLFTWVFPILFGITTILLIILSVKNYIYKQSVSKIEKEYQQKKEALEKEYNDKNKKLNQEYTAKLNNLNLREHIIFHVLKSQSPFRDVAQMAADMETYLYEKDEKYLRYKPHPAYSAADKVKEIRETCKEQLTTYKEIKYKYDFIIDKFPEIKSYVENDFELISIAEYISYSDLKDNRDRSRDYLSDDEWKKLSVSQRNQLALDRYIQKRKKSNWAIGRDYEMSCAYSLRKKGYFVEMHGIEKRLDDLGRDLIAMRFNKTLFETDYTKGEVFVIQCKCWNKDFPVRENVLMQLYGTTVAYQIENKKILGTGIKVTPVLMIPSFTNLSDMAISFAEVLGIRILRQDFVEFPRIKCNINGNSKIYHLPFDQQYDTAQIKNIGEFYAFTVAEAESKGFRRAMRHMYN